MFDNKNLEKFQKEDGSFNYEKLEVITSKQFVTEIKRYLELKKFQGIILDIEILAGAVFIFLHTKKGFVNIQWLPGRTYKKIEVSSRRGTFSGGNEL